MTHTHHALDYVEFNVSDLAEARAFYESAFGWVFNDYGSSYAGICSPTGEGEVGGLNATKPPVPGGPLALLYSEHLDATVDAVTAAGGQITEAPYEFPGGRRFHFADPSGNEVGVWSPR